MNVSETDRRRQIANELRERLGELLADHDRADAVTEALRVVRAHEVDIPTLYVDVLTPLMADVGVGWQKNLMCVWEEHLASAAVRTIVDALYPRVLELKLAADPTSRKVLLACPPDEAHDLGLRMLSDLFDIAGWDTYLLGADVPTAEIADAAAQLGVDLVVLTSATHFHRVRIRHIVELLHARVPGVRVVIAGAAYAKDTQGLADDEVFRAAEFFGPSDTHAAAAAGGATVATDGTADAPPAEVPAPAPRKRKKRPPKEGG
ncbi:MAG TPA: cobalamin-dependent protein [Coriobacteriia bacterium]